MERVQGVNGEDLGKKGPVWRVTDWKSARETKDALVKIQAFTVRNVGYQSAFSSVSSDVLRGSPLCYTVG